MLRYADIQTDLEPLQRSEEIPLEYLRENERTFSRSVTPALRRAFSVQGSLFWDWLKSLHLHQMMGTPVPDGADQFRRAIQALVRAGVSPAIRNFLNQALADTRPLLMRLETDGNLPAVWRQLIEILVPLAKDVAKDKEVYITGQSRGVGKWPVFRMMRATEKREERIREDDPELYEALMKYRNNLHILEDNIQARMQEEGLQNIRRRFVMGRTVFEGTSPSSGEVLVYDHVRPVGTPKDQYMADRKRDVRALDAGTKVFLTEEEFKALPRVPDEIVDALPGAATFTSLTDDKVKSQALTRILPVKDFNGRQVVVAGRYKGMYLDDLVNASGRMIEGTAFNFNPKTGRSTQLKDYEKIETRGPDGQPKVEAKREPYITVSETKIKVPGQKKPVVQKRLYLAIPSTYGPFTELRNAVYKLSQMIPSIQVVPNSRRSSYYFDPKDFSAIQDALRSFALSKAANDLLKSYFEELAHAERATADENLGHYTAEAIGGFKEGVRLHTSQRKALAWMEARGNNGVCSLETGMGKTATCIAMMQKLVRDGIADTGNGRYLLVVPRSLRGNFQKEIQKFLTPQAAAALVARLDILTYPQFQNAFRKDPHFADNFVAIFFDEAHALRNPRSKLSQSAMKINHPRKVLLTASPIEKEATTDAYVLAAIAANQDLSPRTPGRRAMLGFQKRFAENVGGKIVGVKQDPIVKRDLQSWVKQNVFYRDKTDVTEYELPSLVQETVALSMPPEVESLYRDTAKDIVDLLRGMVGRYKHHGRMPGTNKKIPEAFKKELSKFFTPRLASLLRLLNQIANMPEKFVPEIAERNPNGTPVLRPDGRPVMRRLQNPKLMEAFRIAESGWTGSDSRTLMFSDDGEFVAEAARQMSERMPGTFHVAALQKTIQIFQNGEPLSKFMGFAQPFKEREYRKFPDLPESETNKTYAKASWQKFVLDEVVSPTRSVVTCALHGQVYQTGQNLQSFSQVVHLDRDTWNNEDMKQRTARAWRQGQTNRVQEVTLDLTYENPRDMLDATLDEIRAAVQDVDAQLFQEIIRQSQTILLGKEFFGTMARKSRYFDLGRRNMELMMSPYFTQSDVPVPRESV